MPKMLKTALLMQSELGGGCDGGGKGALVQEDKIGTLNTGNDQTIFCYGISAYESNAMKSSNPHSGIYEAETARTLEQARSIGYAEEQAPTLNAECGGNKPAVIAFAQNQREEVRNVGDKAVSLAAEAGMHCQTFVALDMSHACDVIRDCGEVSPSLQARMGTGGNQVPLTYQMQGFGDYRNGDVASSCKQRDFKDSTDLAITNMIVRRLTPMECERLQGFPDGWTDIGEWTDEKGKKHKDADSPRYKALGNSIALPFWDWMLRRMARYLPEGATLGSLFDGIGGFPLVFERIHGKGTARWASEIEEFPIAVTKLRFGEE